jgi:hypothetical protein
VHALHGHIAPLGGVLGQGPARGGNADVRRQAVLLKVYEPGVVFAQVLGAHFDDSVGGQHAELGVLTLTMPVLKACFFNSVGVGGCGCGGSGSSSCYGGGCAHGAGGSHGAGGRGGDVIFSAVRPQSRMLFARTKRRGGC